MTLRIRITNENGIGAAEVGSVDVALDGTRCEREVKQLLGAGESTDRHVYPGTEIVVREMETGDNA